MTKQEIKQAVRTATSKAIMARMPERTIISVERCAVLLELFYFHWYDYKEALKMNIELSELKQFIELKGFDKQQERTLMKFVKEYVKEINDSCTNLEGLLKVQSEVFDKLPEERRGELEVISNNIFNAMKKELV